MINTKITYVLNDMDIAIATALNEVVDDKSRESIKLMCKHALNALDDRHRSLSVQLKDTERAIAMRRLSLELLEEKVDHD